jgi:hypothetical protein
MLGTVIGVSIRLVFPSVDFGMSLLIGVLTAISAIRFLAQFLTWAETWRPLPIEGAEEQADQASEEDELNESPLSRLPMLILPHPILPSKKARRRRRR